MNEPENVNIAGMTSETPEFIPTVENPNGYPGYPPAYLSTNIVVSAWRFIKKHKGWSVGIAAAITATIVCVMVTMPLLFATFFEPRTESERVQLFEQKLSETVPSFNPEAGLIESPKKGVYIINSPDEKSFKTAVRERQESVAFYLMMFSCKALMGNDFVKDGKSHRIIIRYANGEEIQSSYCGTDLFKTYTNYVIRGLS